MRSGVRGGFCIFISFVMFLMLMVCCILVILLLVKIMLCFIWVMCCRLWWFMFVLSWCGLNDWIGCRCSRDLVWCWGVWWVCC